MLEGLVDFRINPFALSWVSIVFLPIIILQILFWGPTKKFFSRWKLSEIGPKPEDFRHDLIWSVIAFVVAGYLVNLVMQVGENMGWLKIYYNVSERGISYWIASLIFYFFYVDAVWYWFHRFLHLPLVFKYVHYVHHHSKAPTPITGTAGHPLERFGLTFVGVLLPMMIFPLHSYIFLIHAAIYRPLVILRHLGHDFLTEKLRHFPILKFFAFGAHHEFHHSRVGTNYGLIFVLWDRWMETETPYFKTDYENYAKNKV
jgi:Delta7-sterol 5-desaturase